jgi:3-hydroxy acid dehydrogenase/malonic semialdehyde reductase
MQKEKQKIAFITGATSGIGEATAYLLAEHGYALIICGRRQQALDELEASLSAKTKITTLCFDVADQKAVNASILSLPKEFQAIDVLINNAGNAHGLDPIQNGSVTDWEMMLDINVKGLLYVSQPIIQGMLARKNGGHIINIGSTAGKEVYPNGNVYCASKHAVDALNQGMRMDLYQHGIKVGAIHPGLVATNFSNVRFKGDQTKAARVYQGYQPLEAKDIAEIIAFVISRPFHVNIADLVVMPTDQASSTMVNRS